MFKKNSLLIILIAFFLISYVMPIFFEAESFDYMPLWLHSSVEMFSIVIAMLIFAITWNSQKSQRQGYLLILAAGFLAVGIIDFMHLLSVKGMPEFVTPSSVEKGTNFWLVARLVSALSLVAVAWMNWTNLSNPRHQTNLIIFSVMFIVRSVSLNCSPNCIQECSVVAFHFAQ